MGKVNKWAISEIAFIEKWYPIYGSKYCSKENQKDIDNSINNI